MALGADRDVPLVAIELDAPSAAVEGNQPGVSVSARGLTHRYRGAAGAGDVTVLAGLDLDIAAGSYVAITGPSGAGKSTLLSLLGGLEAPQVGEVRVGGQDLRRLTGDGLAAYRRSTVGFVFQHFGLLEALTAEENVELACTLAGSSRRDRRRRAGELLAAVGLAHRSRHQPRQLSGGERQRVAIARALANEPRLVLADEPTGNLDEGSTDVVMDLLGALSLDRGCTLIVVTHSRAVAARADWTMHLSPPAPLEPVRP